MDAVTIRDKVGSDYTDYMLQLQEVTPTSANWAEYARLMHDQATVRRAKELADKLLEAVNIEDCRPIGVELSKLLSGSNRAEAWTMREMLDSFFASQDPDAPAPEYITTGIREIDDGSFTELGDIMIVGGYPSDGKTAYALMLAYHMAQKHKVGFFSLETSREKVRDRVISHVGQVDFGAIKRRTLSEGDWKALAELSNDMVGRDRLFWKPPV